jgi:hypothetical protein
MRRLHVRGVGLFTPGFASAAAFVKGERDEAAEKPEAKLLAGPFKRRASVLTRIAVDAYAQAAEQAGADLSSAPSVWGMVHGEIATAVDLMGMMNRGEGKLSPTKFHNSVYNTASGYASMAGKNRAPSTTLSGGSEIVANGLIEAAGLLGEGAAEVLVVWADEPYPPPFEASQPIAPLAIALCLGSEPAGSIAELTDLRRKAIAPIAPPAEFTRLYGAAALPLVERILRGTPGRVPLELASDHGERLWSAELGFSD